MSKPRKSEPAAHAASTTTKSMRCPRCSKNYPYISVSAHKPFPFCSERCRDVDLGNWMMDKYQISTPLLPHQVKEGAEPDQNLNPMANEDLEGLDQRE